MRSVKFVQPNKKMRSNSFRSIEFRNVVHQRRTPENLKIQKSIIKGFQPCEMDLGSIRLQICPRSWLVLSAEMASFVYLCMYKYSFFHDNETSTYILQLQVSCVRGTLLFKASGESRVPVSNITKAVQVAVVDTAILFVDCASPRKCLQKKLVSSGV